MTSQVRATFLKNALLSSESDDVFIDSLPHCIRQVWPITGIEGTIDPSADLCSNKHFSLISPR